MPNYTVIIEPLAQLEIDEAYEYLESQQKGLGFDFLEEIVHILEYLEDNPFLFQKVSGERRRAITRRFNYNVIYLIIEKEVFILAVMHGRSNPKNWKNR